MKSFEPASMKSAAVQQILAGAVAPRPIAFASTIDKNGIPNLSPFSFFNAFGSNPAILVFSPARRGRDNTIKHTLENLKEVAEVVINVVNFAMVEQTSLASTEYEKGVNEFVKAGFTAIASDTIRPFRVKESPVQFECTVDRIIETGLEGGAGNLVVCRVQKMHVDVSIIDEFGNIDPNKIDLVGRMGEDFYVRASGEALFKVEKPGLKKGIGIDALPAEIRTSKEFSGNELAKFGSLEKLPVEAKLEDLKPATQYQLREENKSQNLLAKELIRKGEIEEAYRVLLIKSQDI
ncbi:MAG: flavin reductase family protein [Bacteroidales bacterium]|nr:flavin reductase family protein [Bacteroidales bacterium]